LVLAGALGSTLVAVLLFVRWGINGKLSRDEGIYTYGGQQLAHGVAPYVSIFDPKSPGATMLAGISAGVGHLFGRNDVYFIRLGFLLLSLLTVVAVYALAVWLWRSVAAGVVAAVVFAAFTGFAEDALSGPDAKTPGIAAIVFAMWLACRRQWFWSGIACGIAFLVWQPLIFFPIVIAVVAALTSEAGTRWRAFLRTAAGGILPVAAVVIYFAIVGALGKFIEAAFVFPLTGVQRGPVTLGERVTRIAGVVHSSYGVSGALLWIGMAALVGVAVVRIARSRPQWRSALADPLICIILLTLGTQLLYAFADFQGYPDVYPLLPYGAIGMGGLAAVVVAAVRSESGRNIATSAVLGVTLVFAAMSWVWFGDDPANNNQLRDERADACAVQRIAGPDARIYALGDATPLILTHKRNPDRFIYLGSGVDRWRIKHTTGGFDAWTAKIQSAQPEVVVVAGWHGGVRPRIIRFLRQAGYTPRFIGPWLTFLTPAALDAARQHGVALQQEPSAYATGPRGNELPPAPCH
jgi:4-amino-4-deoxy-L-arabinose transferase-like glycosyltransferase